MSRAVTDFVVEDDVFFVADDFIGAGETTDLLVLGGGGAARTVAPVFIVSMASALVVSALRCGVAHAATKPTAAQPARTRNRRENSIVTSGAGARVRSRARGES